MRFRKSVKICKGVKINFSKSGISTTFGGKGMSVNVGKKGTYLNTGIPGTGFYNRTKIGGSSSIKKSSSVVSTTRTVSQTINLKLDDNGVITFYDENNRLITDQSMIRKIKSTPAFKAERERMMSERFESINAESDKFINIHKLSAKVYNQQSFIEVLEDLELKTYIRKTFTKQEPTVEVVSSILKRRSKN